MLGASSGPLFTMSLLATRQGLRKGLSRSRESSWCLLGIEATDPVRVLGAITHGRKPR
jgi:hypothetical protein